jgi:hypothetical protein
VQTVGLLRPVRRPLTHVLDRQACDDREHRVEHAARPGFHQHPRETRIHRHAGELTADRGQSQRALVADNRAEFHQQIPSGRHSPRVGRGQEREGSDVSQAEREQLQNDGGETGAQHLRIGELGPAFQILLRVEPDRDAGSDPTRATRALLRRRLRHRLDRQALHLRAGAVP